MEKFLPLSDLGEGWITLIDFAAALAAGLILMKLTIVLVRKGLRKTKLMDEVIHVFIINAVKVVCTAVLIIILLDSLNVSITSIIAVLGAAGAAIALALKDSLANIAGGFMIIMTQPFRKGDLIQVNEFRGRVQEIDLFLTTLKTLDFKTVTIPNGIINTSVLVNESSEDVRRVDCSFSISYDSDIDEVKVLLSEICTANSMILSEPETSIGVRVHGESAVIMEVLAWCRTEDYFKVQYYLQETVKKVFDEKGIEIPYPHVDVRVRDRV